MTRVLLAGVGPPPLMARLVARRWENTAPNVSRREPEGLSAGRNPGRITLALFGMLVLLVCLRRARRSRGPAPAIDRLTAADERHFALLCQQATHTRAGVEQ